MRYYPMRLALIAMILLILGALFINLGRSQDYTGKLPAQYNQKKMQDKFDILWNYIRGQLITDGGRMGFSGNQLTDTIYLNIKFDSIYAVALTLDSIHSLSIGSDTAISQSLACIKILGDSSVQIKRRFAISADTIFWMVTGRIKLNF